MKMNKLLALTLAGAMIFSTPVFAADSPTAGDVSGADSPTADDVSGAGSSTTDDISGAGSSTTDDISGAGSSTTDNISGAGSSTTDNISGAGSSTTEAATGTNRGSSSSSVSAGSSIPGIPSAAVAGAANENKSIGEYMNNAITEVPGLDEAVPLGQGGQVIINGAASNQVFSIMKPTIAEVSLAKAQAVSLGGKVLNVAQINASVNFETASVNFYMPGIKAGQNVQVYQLVKGQWKRLTVSEIREDHVVVNMTSLGTLAFIEASVQ